jgi:ABC-type transport system involved in cytochrome bd biosynthesis fused ATPase/permease subunit
VSFDSGFASFNSGHDGWSWLAALIWLGLLLLLALFFLLVGIAVGRRRRSQAAA